MEEGLWRSDGSNEQQYHAPHQGRRLAGAQGQTQGCRVASTWPQEVSNPCLPHPGLSPATMASRSPSRFGRIRMNSCRRKGATSVLLFTNIRMGFFKETEARSFTCQAQRQGAHWPARRQGGRQAYARPRPPSPAQPGSSALSLLPSPRRIPAAHLIRHCG